jgi:hypothetical protein
MNAIRSKFSQHKKDLLILAIILAAGLKFTYNLGNSIDIGLYDETTYLQQGIKLVSVGLPQASWGPLYAVWYYLISLFSPNKIALYFLNYTLMTILQPVLGYIFLRKNRVSILTSLFVSYFLLIFNGNIYVWPKVNHFALLIILLTLILAIHVIKSHILFAIIISIGALLASFVHPELFLTFVLSFIFLAILIISERKRLNKYHHISLLIYISIVIALLTTVGLPISGNRSLIAFGQHFSFTVVGAPGTSSLNPWTDWQEIFTQNFGKATNLAEAFNNNTPRFLQYIKSNIKYFPKAFHIIIFARVFPTDRFSTIILSILLIVLCIAFSSNIRKNFAEKKELFIFGSLFLVPEIISAIIIYPEVQVLLILAVLVILGMTILLAGNQEGAQLQYRHLLLLGLFIIMVTPYYASSGSSNQPVIDTIHFIQSLKIKKPINMLEGDGGYCVYLESNCNTVWTYDKSTGFDQFLKQDNINMIIVDNNTLNDSRFVHDPEWHNFLVNYGQMGYTELEIPGTGSKLIIQNSLIK